MMQRNERRDHRFALYRSDPHCHYCGRCIVEMKKSTIDHVLPLSEGGDDVPENMVLCCLQCNAMKAGRSPAMWAPDPVPSIGRMLEGRRTASGSSDDRLINPTIPRRAGQPGCFKSIEDAAGGKHRR